MDNAFSRPFAGYSLADLRLAIKRGHDTPAMIAEVARREAVEAGDTSQMTASERLRAAKKK